MSLFFNLDGRSFHTDGADERKLRWSKRTVHERGTTMSPWWADRISSYLRLSQSPGHTFFEIGVLKTNLSLELRSSPYFLENGFIIRVSLNYHDTHYSISWSAMIIRESAMKWKQQHHVPCCCTRWDRRRHNSDRMSWVWCRRSI